MLPLSITTISSLPSAIDPIAFEIGRFPVRWYSLMYLAALATIFLLVRWRIRHDSIKPVPDTDPQTTWELFLEGGLYAFLGLLVGARIGDILFYNLHAFILNPQDFLLPFRDGEFVGYRGMSFHGGLAGALAAGYLYCRLKKLPLIRLVDYLIPAIGLGYFWGRVGNFLNGELYGRPTGSPWGMVFTSDPDGLARHPSQLYEALGEGLVIFLVLWPLRNNAALQGKFLALYLILYGAIRFFIEYFREPEKMVGFLTMGQVLCLGMIVIGAGVLIGSPRLKEKSGKAV